MAQRENFHEALDNFNRSLELEPGNSAVFYERAIVYERIDRDELAEDDYSAAIRLSPEFVLAFNNRGLLLSRLEKYEDAIQDFSKMIQLEADNPNAYESRGKAYAALDRPHEAIADFSQAILLESASLGFDLDAQRLSLGSLDSPESPEASQDAFEVMGAEYIALLLSLRGQQYLQLKNYEDALIDFDLALQQDPDLARAWLGRSISLASLGEFEEAELDLEEAANADLGIVSDDIVVALRNIANLKTKAANGTTETQATQHQSASTARMEPEDLAAFLAERGWNVIAPIDGYDLYEIQSVESSLRSTLFIVETDSHGYLKMTGPQYATLVKSKQPKSLLVDRLPSEGGLRFIPNWSSAGIQLEHVAVNFTDPSSLATSQNAAERASDVAAQKEVRLAAD